MLKHLGQGLSLRFQLVTLPRKGLLFREFVRNFLKKFFQEHLLVAALTLKSMMWCQPFNALL